MKEAKIFEGCKHLELIDEYIRGVKEGAKQSQLQALKEEVGKKIEILKRQGKHSGIYNYDKDCTLSIIAYLEGVLNLITNLEDK